MEQRVWIRCEEEGREGEREKVNMPVVEEMCETMRKMGEMWYGRKRSSR